MGDCEAGSRQEPLLSQQALELLDKHHQFPSQYMFKVIGFGGPGFAEDVACAAEAVLGPLDRTSCLRCRPSSGGKYLSVTLEMEMASAQQVLDIYAALRTVQGVVILV
jgi:putative lipoic acid-binding regulatory protein